MRRLPDDPANTRLDVDWARLTVLSPTTLDADTVSPEQEALNKEVKDSGALGSSKYDDQADTLWCTQTTDSYLLHFFASSFSDAYQKQIIRVLKYSLYTGI